MLLQGSLLLLSSTLPSISIHLPDVGNDEFLTTNLLFRCKLSSVLSSLSYTPFPVLHLPDLGNDTVLMELLLPAERVRHLQPAPIESPCIDLPVPEVGLTITW